MRKISIILLIVCAIVAVVFFWHRSSTPKPEPQASRGHLTSIPDFPSAYISPRTVWVWTPESFSQDSLYEVLYMHDGRMLFDSTASWNHQAWDIDDVAQQMLDSGTLRPCIIVGIDNSPKRIDEYCPDDIAHYLEDNDPIYLLGEPMGNRYLSFVVDELKPYIDSVYPTLPDREHTFVMGSSCGGLISSYFLCKRPDIFGGAACMSTHTVFAKPFLWVKRPRSTQAYFTYLRNHLPQADSSRFYMDCGDQSLDAFYLDNQDSIDAIVRALGWDNDHFLSLRFPGHAHTETDWHQRVHIPLGFLLGK